MAKKHTHRLGVALTERSVRLVETHGQGASAKPGKSSILETDVAALFENPAAFGRLLGEHLKQEGYTAKHAAVGLCSRWVLPRVMSVVKADDAATAGIVRLRIEQDFAGGQSDLVFDYQEAPDIDGKRSLLLVGVPARRINKIKDAFAAAGLGVASLSALALDTTAGEPDGLSVVLEQGGAVAVRQTAGKAAHFASVPCDPQRLADGPERERLAAGTLRVAATALGWSGGDGGRACLLDAAGLDESTRSATAEALSERVGNCTAKPTDAALAVARAYARPGGINLLDSRLAVRPPRRMPSYTMWLARAAVLLILVGGVVGYLWLDANKHLADLQQQYDAIEGNADRLELVRQNTRAATGWFDNRPPVLDCLLELTRTFPVHGRIWVTGLSLDENASGVLNCRADDEETMWRYLRAMSESEALSDVVLRQQNTAGRSDADLVFEVSFTYRPINGEQH
ncbi:MAG: hypothetical protein ACIAXF_02995 [Phycisphaerales bacterium JB063]